VDITSDTPIYVLVRTVKESATTGETVQQSDYTHAWETGNARPFEKPDGLDRFRRAAARWPALFLTLRKFNQKTRKSLQFRRSRLAQNRNLEKLSIASLIR
jgi:hypothetical protein